MRESKKQKAERIRAALAALKEAYPDAKPELNFTSPFELLVATMLSAQCTDKQVNKTTAVLFPLYNTRRRACAVYTKLRLLPNKGQKHNRRQQNNS